MDAIFFVSTNSLTVDRFEDIQDGCIIGCGVFSKDNITDLLRLLDDSLVYEGNCWLLPYETTKVLINSDDEQIKNIASNWSELNSWVNVAINSMDLAGHLFELKYNYVPHAGKRICVLFE